ncbi:MAG: SIS domain-containing protein [Candidatus Methanomethylophilaceae archaeon]|jgi:glucose/mannose-6-phosphate isomerase
MSQHVPVSDKAGAAIDKMFSEVRGFADDLSTAASIDIDLNYDFDRIMMCGMGGSAITGDIIHDCVVRDVDVPITVQRYPFIPGWVNERTLAIVSSYSGNTRETLSMYNQIVDLKCPRILITSGGKLEKLGTRNGDLILRLKKGIQPRSALGANLGYIACIMDEVCGTHCGDEIRKLVPSLYVARDELDSEDSIAKQAADFIGVRVPIIYTTAGIYASAIRWMGQINENSKMLAFAGSVPEFNYNEISGWSEGELRDRCAPVFLYECEASEEIRKLADKAIGSLKEYGQDVFVVPIKGATALERSLNAVMIGDYTSLHLARSQGVDPMSVETINDFKRRLGNNLRDN